MVENHKNMPTRDAYGHALLELLQTHKNIIVLDADLSRSTRTEWIDDKYPEQFYNMGIAEQNMIGVAAGMAMEGLIPFATTYAIFIGRAFDQIRQAVSYANTNVKIVVTHAGLAASYDGGSHQSVEDLALMRVLPNMTILSPCDYNEAKQAVKAAAIHHGPVYIRLQKEATPLITAENEPFIIGKLREIRKGKDVVIFATGTVCVDALAAAEILAHSGISVCVVSVATIKPLDTIALTEMARQFQAVVVVEEHSCFGGLYEAVCGAMQGGLTLPIWSVNIPDCYSETGAWIQLKEKFHLTPATMAAKLNMLLQNMKPH